MQSSSFATENLAKLAALFPGCVAEATKANTHTEGKRKTIDFGLLHQQTFWHNCRKPRGTLAAEQARQAESLIAGLGSHCENAQGSAPAHQENLNFANSKPIQIF